MGELKLRCGPVLRLTPFLLNFKTDPNATITCVTDVQSMFVIDVDGDVDEPNNPAQGSENCSPNPAPCLFLSIKLYWSTGHPFIYISCYDCVPATKAGLSRGDRDAMAHRAQRASYLALSRESLTTLGLKGVIK